jgi:hypothetical protein
MTRLGMLELENLAYRVLPKMNLTEQDGGQSKAAVMAVLCVMLLYYSWQGIEWHLAGWLIVRTRIITWSINGGWIYTYAKIIPHKKRSSNRRIPWTTIH